MVEQTKIVYYGTIAIALIALVVAGSSFYFYQTISSSFKEVETDFTELKYTLDLTMDYLGIGSQELEIYKAAKAEGTLIVYYSMAEMEMTYYLTTFKAKYGIDVKAAKYGGSELFSKCLTEAEVGRIEADIVQMDATNLEVLKREGLLQPYTSKTIEQIPREQDGVIFRDIDNMYTVISMNIYTPYINTNFMSEAEAKATFKSWEDFFDPQWKSLMVHGDPAYSAGVMCVVMGMQTLYGSVENYYTNLQDQDVLMVKSIGSTTTMVVSGERPIGISGIAAYAWRARVQNGEPISTIWPEEGNPWAPIGISIIKDCTHPNTAKLFIDHILTREVQEWQVANNAQSVTIPGIPPPQGYPALEDLTLLPIDYDWLFDPENREEIIEEFHTTLGSYTP